MFVGFFTSRIILDSLGVVDYGLYNVVGGIVGMLGVINPAMAGATQRWITIALGKEDINYLKKVFSVGMTSQVILVVIALFLTETIGLWYLYNHAVIPVERFDTCFWVFQISVLTMALDIIGVPFLGSIMAHEKMGAFAFLSIIDVLMKLVVCYALYISTRDNLLLYSCLIFLTFAITFLLQQIYCHRNFIEARFKFGWDQVMYKEMWQLASWSISGNIAYVGYSQGITMLINLFFGPVMNAAAGIANQAGNVINHFSGNFQTALNPQIVKNFAKEDFVAMNQLVFRASKFSFFLMLIFSVPLFLEAPLLLDIWLKKVPEHSVNFLRIGLFVSMFMALRNPLVTAANATGKVRKHASVVVSILLTIMPISYVILKLGGIPESASFVILFVTIVATFASAYILSKMIHLNFKDFVNQVMYKVFLVTLVSFALPSLIFYVLDEGLVRLIILSATSTVSTCFAVLFIGFSYSERIFVIGMIKSKLGLNKK